MPLGLFHDVLKHFYVYPFFSRPLLLLLSVFVLPVLALFACVLSFISCISRSFAQQSSLDSTHAQTAFFMWRAIPSPESARVLGWRRPHVHVLFPWCWPKGTHTRGTRLRGERIWSTSNGINRCRLQRSGRMSRTMLETNLWEIDFLPPKMHTNKNTSHAEGRL